jgi:hypothetical protein
MKCRQLTFYAEPAAVEIALATIVDEVVPQYISLPHFLGYVVLQTEIYPGHVEGDGRRQLTVMSFWHTGLEGSEAAANEFIGEIHRVAGTNPTRKRFDLLKAMWRDSNGEELAEFP